ncbi:B-cell receptor CD22-like isoform 2-T3 [Odontesthes bonariensis]|uniref:B-cell receptor CD22-like isoform X2 n=1 Tax=Odontesthes bonariensis TaxID=219752 RepID=UPI003F580AC4
MERWILIILTIIPGVWGGNWKVTLENQCALRGTSVVLKCEYDYPFGNIVTVVRWFKVQQVSGNRKLLPLSDLPSPPDFTYIGNYRGDCKLNVNNVQPADEGEYAFGFTATFGGFISQRYAYLSVKELTTVVQPSTVTEGGTVRLTCSSGCPQPVEAVLFKDGQLVLLSVFRARIEDAGRYYCVGLFGQKTVRSASVALKVHYAPKKVNLTMSPSEDIIKGGTVAFTCSSDANPPVTQSGYSLYRDGEFVSSGQNHNISDIQPSHSGRYHCRAWNSISWRGSSLINSSEITLDVQYRPMNISVSVDPQPVVEGNSVNLTCSSTANPAADNYTWYKRTETPISSSMVQVGSGQVLSLPSMGASHTGFYVCRVRSSLGGNNSTEVMLDMKETLHGSHTLPVLAGIGIAFFMMLVIVLLLFCLLKKKQPASPDTKQTDFSGIGSSSEDPYDTVYANVQMFPSSPLPVATASQRDSHCDAPKSHEEVTYSTVTIKTRNLRPPSHTNNSGASHDSRSKMSKTDISVIYATVTKSS